ncbi:DHCW motif cupin fold protein [Microbacterium murale]|uniref:DHCW motif cupin fold protein n=1 Tax=Microbacterium murale TaxID=1081040 RepID=A0ABU0P888_9MICO|nr:DHCW motif cupin fold protein [Microbacterium murale]MDQ0643167.1 hypothetical protein [Microbacterium murale]
MTDEQAGPVPGQHAFSTTDWDAIAPTVHPGESGKALWRTKTIGALRLRKVEYTPRYLADHWCSRGHVLLVLNGELHTELDDGRVVTLHAGQSYEVANDQEAHRSSTTTGATLFIVD